LGWLIFYVFVGWYFFDFLTKMAPKSRGGDPPFSSLFRPWDARAPNGYAGAPFGSAGTPFWLLLFPFWLFLGATKVEPKSMPKLILHTFPPLNFGCLSDGPFRHFSDPGTPALPMGTPALHLAPPALRFGCFCFPFGFLPLVFLFIWVMARKLFCYLFGPSPILFTTRGNCSHHVSAPTWL
jgi:hypothetical protein